VIGQRAQDGARKLYQIITDKPDKSDKPDKKAPDHTGSIDGAGDDEATPAATARGDTLTQDDLVTEWRGTTSMH
jgi:hypothetical protein